LLAAKYAKIAKEKKRGESNGTDIENPTASPDFPSGFLRVLSVLCGGLL
jgi:hypothetical protein